MLKRQRPISPLHSTLDLPDDLSPILPTKRRRTLPPSLDGVARGWGSADMEDEDDDEELEAASNATPGDDRSLSNAVTDAYKSANNFLHDLHASHHHRFAYTALSPHSNGSYRPHASFDHVHSLSPRKPGFRNYLFRDEATCSVPSPENILYEVDRVRERYEDTNRFAHA